jgi:hypothetical protein
MKAEMEAALNSSKYGVEVEFIGNRPNVARAISTVLGGTDESNINWSQSNHGCYQPISITDQQGRTWKVIRDGSVHGGGEMVTPPLRYSDIELLQEVIRAMRTIGRARVNSSCGVHIHVDGSKLDASGLCRLAGWVYKNEELVYKALGTSESRVNQWCRRVNENMVSRINRAKPKTREAFAQGWYGASYWQREAGQHYHSSRYHGLNLHSTFGHLGTVEFRWFDGTLHAGKIRAYIQLSLGIVAKAERGGRAARRISTAGKRAFEPVNARYDIHHMLHQLWLTGPEFKTARHHLTNHLPGVTQSTRVSAAA